MNQHTFCLAVTLVLVLMPNSALAYIGPGAGLSAIGTFVAVIGAFLLLVVGFVWYPMKRVLRGRKVKRNTAENQLIDPNT